MRSQLAADRLGDAAESRDIDPFADELWTSDTRASNRSGFARGCAATRLRSCGDQAVLVATDAGGNVARYR